MGAAGWLIGVAIVCIVAFVILRPDRWGRGEGGFYAADTRRRDDDNDGDSDGGDGDGGGGD